MGAAPFPRSGKRKRALLISKLRANERRHPRGDRAGHATAPAPGAAAHNAASLPRPAAHLPPPATSAAFPASAPASPSASAPAAPPAAPPATSNLIPRYNVSGPSAFPRCRFPRLPWPVRSTCSFSCREDGSIFCLGSPRRPTSTSLARFPRRPEHGTARARLLARAPSSKSRRAFVGKTSDATLLSSRGG